MLGTDFVPGELSTCEYKVGTDSVLGILQVSSESMSWVMMLYWLSYKDHHLSIRWVLNLYGLTYLCHQVSISWILILHWVLSYYQASTSLYFFNAG